MSSTYVCLSGMCASACACMCVYMHVGMHACTCTYANVHTGVRGIRVHIAFVCIFVGAHVCVCMGTGVCVCMYVSVHVQIIRMHVCLVTRLVQACASLLPICVHACAQE